MSATTTTTTTTTAATAATAATATANVPYVGSRISLISKSAIRYVGTLYTIDTNASTVALKDVRSFGTEGRARAGGPVQPSDRVFSYIVFHGPDISDLQFLDSPPSSQPAPPPPPPPPPPQQPQQPRTQQQQQTRLLPRDQPKPLAPPTPPSAAPTPTTTTAPLAPSRAMAVRGPKPRAWGPPPTVRAPARAVAAPPTNSQPKPPASSVPAATKPAPAPPRARLNNGSNHNPEANTRGAVPSRRGHGRRRAPRAAPLRIPEEDFDFERNNERFEKPAQAQIAPLYDSKKSFFDELIPEKEMRGERNAAQRRQTDVETFGDAAVASARRGARGRSRHARRGRSRARGGGGGGGSGAAGTAAAAATELSR